MNPTTQKIVKDIKGTCSIRKDTNHKYLRNK